MLTSTRIVEPATPEYVLSVIRDRYRQQCEYDPEAERGIDLRFESTIAEWRRACDLVSWRPLSKALQEWFGVSLPQAEWKQLLEPAKERRLGRLCEAIAHSATRERVVPKKMFGNLCQTASVFLTVRELLGNAGADVSDLRPDSPLAEYARKYPGVFAHDLGKLYPGRLPAVKISTPSYTILALAVGVLALVAFACRIMGYACAAEIAGVAFLVGCLLMFPVSRLKPKSVSFGSLNTFRDLANALVDERSGRVRPE